MKWVLGVVKRSIFKQNFIIRLTGDITKRKREELIFDLWASKPAKYSQVLRVFRKTISNNAMLGYKEGFFFVKLIRARDNILALCRKFMNTYWIIMYLFYLFQVSADCMIPFEFHVFSWIEPKIRSVYGITIFYNKSRSLFDVCYWWSFRKVNSRFICEKMSKSRSVITTARSHTLENGTYYF